jgi:hypothetical protein
MTEIDVTRALVIALLALAQKRLERPPDRLEWTLLARDLDRAADEVRGALQDAPELAMKT